MLATLMGLKSLSCSQVLDGLAQSVITVIDVNAPARWAVAHVPGSLNLDPDRFNPGGLPAAKDAALVFYCSGYLCTKAPRAAKRARAMGYANVAVMSAGIQGWLAAGLAVQRSP